MCGHLILRGHPVKGGIDKEDDMNNPTIQNAIDFSGLTSEFGGNISIFAPTKDMGDPIDVHVLRGKFSTGDLAELVWTATLSDSEIDGFCGAESLMMDGRYERLAGYLVA